ncbi:MAG: ATP-binding protein [Terracidiphilus sp.]
MNGKPVGSFRIRFDDYTYSWGTTLGKKKQRPSCANVLIIDQMGYLLLGDLGATIFFQLVSARYERGSLILKSNKSYGEWGSIFGDLIIVTATQASPIYDLVFSYVPGGEQSMLVMGEGRNPGTAPLQELGKQHGIKNTPEILARAKRAFANWSSHAELAAVSSKSTKEIAGKIKLQ